MSLLGQTIAKRYRIHSIIGEGGMGVAYRAWDIKEKIPVVVKTPLAGHHALARLRQRFQREIQAMTRLSHDHVVPISDYGTVGTLPFLVMRYLPGGSLIHRRRRDKKGRPTPVQACSLHSWLPEIAAALDYLHSAGYVHRDVKPGNILFDAFTKPFLSDFGLAKLIDETSADDAYEPLTATYQAVGTSAFMAPERFKLKAMIDGRADQYSLAVTVYDMLAGRRPFTGEIHNLFYEIAVVPPPPLTDFMPTLPLSSGQAIDRGMAKDRTARFDSCTAFADAVLVDIPPPARSPTDDMARILCPSCSKLLKFPVEIAGKKGPCPKCNTVIRVASDLGSLWLRPEQDSGTDDAADFPKAWSRGEKRSESEFLYDVPSYLWEAVSRTTCAAARSWAILHRAVRLEHLPTWERRTTTAAIAVTTVMLVVGLLSAALSERETRDVRPGIRLTIRYRQEPRDFEEFDDLVVEDIDMADMPDVPDVTSATNMSSVEDVKVVANADGLDAAPLAVELTDFSSQTAPAADMLSMIGTIGGTAGGFSGRANAAKLAATSGGGADTEQAVDRALKWIALHQMPDGGWSFDFEQCPGCEGRCSHGGDEGRGKDRCGATAMALLPFLGRGYTHRDGPYKAQIEKSIAFLAAMTMQGKGKSYGAGGSLYSQGLAGIALSECYAMTQDSRLATPTQLALNFIMDAQDPRGGGWRYTPKQAGDTSASGWQIMALKSGSMAHLQVNPLAMKRAIQFLDSVQQQGGAQYGYTDPGDRPGTNAVGLLCRMYLGWKKDHPALQQGVLALAKQGPSSDMYYTYYATQIMHHMEGDVWQAWNERMKKLLLPTQSKKDHEAGSWHEGVNGGHGANVAGRLYCTVLATLTLEAYYRHRPIYRDKRVDGEFKE